MNAIAGREIHTHFSRGLFSLLERVEYRRIVSPEDFDAVGKLRALSYRQQNVLENCTSSSLIDDIDFHPNAFVIGVYIDEVLVSTLRIHHVDAENRAGISMTHFSDVLNPMLDAGVTFVDPARFASDPILMWEYPAIPYLTLRIAAMASVYFNVDQCLSCVNKGISSFYSRSFGSIEIAPARKLDGVTYPFTLYGAKIADIRERLETRFPFFKSQPYEQRMMFGKIEDLAYPPLNILPSAKYANQTGS